MSSVCHNFYQKDARGVPRNGNDYFYNNIIFMFVNSGDASEFIPDAFHACLIVFFYRAQVILKVYPEII